MSLTAEEIRECTMIALDQPPWWPEEDDNAFKFSITIDGSSARPKLVKFFQAYTGSRIFNYFQGTINWGDGIIEEIPEPIYDIFHEYASYGKYTIKMKGHFQYYTLNNNKNSILPQPQLIDSIDSKFPKAEKYWGRNSHIP